MTIAQRVNAERLVLFGWSRAILLQLAHPLVAAGVAEHSGFRAGWFSSIARLHHTIRAMLALTFGTEEERRTALDGIAAIHRRVNGYLRSPVGPYPAGTPYSAEDPALLLWVHATLLESMPLAYELLISPLSDAERDRYCREAASVARDLGAGSGVPESWSDLLTYLDRTYASGQIVVGDAALELASAVLSPPFSVLVAPAAHVNRLITVGLLPDVVRRQYKFEWTGGDEASMRRWVRTLRGMRRLTPRVLREWPEARRARAGGRL